MPDRLYRPSGPDQYREALDRVLDRCRAFNPAYLIIAAGFDTHENDPIGGFRLRTEDFTAIGRQFASFNLPTLICQEGGYDTGVLGDCVKSFLSGFVETLERGKCRNASHRLSMKARE